MFDGFNILEKVSKVHVLREYPSFGKIGQLVESTIGDRPYPIRAELLHTNRTDDPPDGEQIENDQISSPFMVFEDRIDANNTSVDSVTQLDVFLLVFKIVVLLLILVLKFLTIYLFFSFWEISIFLS